MVKMLSEKNTASSALCVGCSTFFTCLLRKYSEQTGNGGQKGNPFDQGRSQDHVSTNVIRSFGLAGNGVNSTFTDLTDTDTGTDSGEACTQRTVTGLNYIQQSRHHRHLI
jgi:hypothetical protein